MALSINKNWGPARPTRAVFAVVGQERLPKPFWDTLSVLPSAVQVVRDGETPPQGIPLLVAVDNQAGLGELTTLVQAGYSVIALYAGNTPSIAVRCAQAGAGRVICLDEIEPAELAGRLSGAATESHWPWAALDILPFGIAIREEDGDYHYRNPVHRAIELHKLNGTDGADIATLDLTQVSDPDSGQVYLWSRIPLPGTGNGQVMELLEDITGRHTDRDEIARQRDMLRHRARDLARINRVLAGLDQAKADFIALAAHEIRTPLTALNTAVHLMNRLKPEKGRERRMVDMAGRNVARLGALADDLLEFTKLETSQMALHLGEANMSTSLWQAMDGVRAEADAMGVIIQCDVGTPLPVLHGERDRIGQAVQRLIEYAVRRSREGEAVYVHAACVSGWQPPNVTGDPLEPPILPTTPQQWVEFSVTDRGATLDTERAEHLFTGFGSAGDQLAGPVSGGGLGLAICRRVVRAHGGVVWAEPSSPAGVKLTMRLPVLSASELGLYQLDQRFERLHRQQQVTWLVSIGSAAGPADAGMLVDVMTDTGIPGSDWVFLEKPDEVVALISGGKGRLLKQLRHLVTRLPSSNGAVYPIQIGWARPDAGERFDSALRRARAAARPLADCTEVTTQTGEAI